MTSIFDQYEKAIPKYAPASSSEMPTTSNTSKKLQEDSPIFSKQKMQFNPSDRITHLAVASDFLVLAMANNTIFRIDLKQPDKNEEIPMNKQTHRISNIFLDPIGNHLLIAMIPRQSDSASELIYLHRKSNKIKSSSKFKGYEITQVGWNNNSFSETTTDHILLGTSKGLIFETEMGLDGDKIFHSSLEQYWKQVFDIGKGSDTPITGLEFHRVSDANKYIILVTTPQRLYQFSGIASAEEKSLLQQIFNSYLNKPEEFLEMPGSLKYSKLKFFCNDGSRVPKAFGWLTEAGLYYAEIDSSRREESSFMMNSTLLQFPLYDTENSNVKKKTFPITFALTEFHALLVYNDRVQGISLLNNDLIFEDLYNESFGKLINIARDPIKGTVWSFTDKAVFRYKVTREERDVWKIYTEKNEFTLAKKYCNDNPAYFDKIQIKEAELLFDKKRYDESALIFAETQFSFEGVCLKFLERNEITALRLFLRKKLEKLLPQDKTQITMITMWIIELYLSQIGNLRNQNLLDSRECHELQMDFDKFMKLPLVYDNICNNKNIIYDLMASHGDNANLIKLTTLNEDYENVIITHLYKGQYLEALGILKRQSSSELFYKHCPILMEEIPEETINLLISRGKLLEPSKLLPALVGATNISDVHMKEIIKYLEFCVHSIGSTQQAIHNYLLTLYVNHYPKKLMQYLATQGQDITMIHYDVHYALRLCRERKLIEACVQLSALLGLWEAAVDLALNVSLDLAKATAAQPNLSDEQRRMLWLKIAKHVLSGKDDIEQAMEFLNQCDLIKIEDLLPFFSDFVTIDHFKDAICDSLEKYNQKIHELKEDMEEATQSAEKVRAEIVSFRNRAAIVTVDNTCELCDIMLMIRPFYLFPCGHKFHADCLQTEIMPLLATTKRNKLIDLQRQLAGLQINISDNASHNSASISIRHHIKEDIDLIIASDCLLCGEFMIQSIDKPFITDDEWDKVAKDWE